MLSRFDMLNQQVPGASRRRSWKCSYRPISSGRPHNLGFGYTKSCFSSFHKSSFPPYNRAFRSVGARLKVTRHQRSSNREEAYPQHGEEQTSKDGDEGKPSDSLSKTKGAKSVENYKDTEGPNMPEGKPSDSLSKKQETDSVVKNKDTEGPNTPEVIAASPPGLEASKSFVENSLNDSESTVTVTDENLDSSNSNTTTKQPETPSNKNLEESTHPGTVEKRKYVPYSDWVNEPTRPLKLGNFLGPVVILGTVGCAVLTHALLSRTSRSPQPPVPQTVTTSSAPQEVVAPTRVKPQAGLPVDSSTRSVSAGTSASSDEPVSAEVKTQAADDTSVQTLLTPKDTQEGTDAASASQTTTTTADSTEDDVPFLLKEEDEDPKLAGEAPFQRLKLDKEILSPSTEVLSEKAQSTQPKVPPTASLLDDTRTAIEAADAELAALRPMGETTDDSLEESSAPAPVIVLPKSQEDRLAFLLRSAQEAQLAAREAATAAAQASTFSAQAASASRGASDVASRVVGELSSGAVSDMGALEEELRETKLRAEQAEHRASQARQRVKQAMQQAKQLEAQAQAADESLAKDRAVAEEARKLRVAKKEMEAKKEKEAKSNLNELVENPSDEKEVGSFQPMKRLESVRDWAGGVAEKGVSSVKGGSQVVYKEGKAIAGVVTSKVEDGLRAVSGFFRRS